WIPASLVKTLFDPGIVEGGISPPPAGLDNLNAQLKYWTYQTIESSNPLASLRFVCILLVVVFLFKNLCHYGQTLILSKLNLNIIRDMRNSLYDHVLRLPVSFFDRTRSGVIVSKILSDVTTVNDSITKTFNKILIEPIRLIAFVSLLLIINVPMTLMVFLVYPFLGIGIVKIGQSVRRRSRRTLENLSGLVSVLHEAMAGLRVVKMFNMNGIEAEKFQRENQRFIHASFRSTRMSALSSPLTETLGSLVTALLLWYGGRMVLNPAIDFTAEDFLRFLLVLISSYRPLKALASVNSSMQSGFAAAVRVFEVLDTPKEPLLPFDSNRVPPFNSFLEARNINFSYPGYTERVLRDVSFRLEKGKIMALVGSSGSGKSTILDCLPRFYDIKEGELRLDGRPITEFDLVGYRHLFGIVSQDTVLFNDTVHNNIAYGVRDASSEQVEKVAQIANALEFIEKLPKGMQTMVGERGVTLSGGQRQRIAIARALLKDPPILLLDEATSALDTESERLVQRAINELMKNRTTVVVAHRLSTIKHADMILVLDKGEIIEYGSHKELLALGGKYRYFHDIQFSNPHTS
ncbi:MAG: ATP-binding cassette domain-containing protein, partial [Chitinivibrionales bacterium]|nr:ATP-binding cassette domain-containing protein [Chitinivibrionales bacterium]